MATETIDINLKITGIKEMEYATASIGEMRKLLRQLQKEPTAGKSMEDIQLLNNGIGQLKNKIQEFTAAARGVDKAKFFQTMTQGLHGLVASAQLVGASMKLMGVESETAKKLEDATLQLISASQALNVLMELKNKRTLQNIVAQIQNAAVTAYSTVVELKEDTKLCALTPYFFGSVVSEWLKEDTKLCALTPEPKFKRGTYVLKEDTKLYALTPNLKVS